METIAIGTSGISASRIALGTWAMGGWMWGGQSDEDQSIRTIESAIDRGITLIDTAPVYGFGRSEEIVGKALKGRRDDVVLATKAHGTMGQDVNMAGNSRRWIVREVENSLRRLQTDYIDLYQMHRPDPDTDIDETLSALSDLVRAGKVRAIGCSTFPADLIVEAQWAADRRGHHRFRSEQPRYSIFSRTIEADVLPVAERHGMGVLTYGPLSSGWLSGRADPTRGHRAEGFGARNFDLAIPGNRAKLDAVGRLTELSAQAGIPLAHLAIGFVRAHPAVTSVIIGPRTPDQLEHLLAGAQVELDGDILDRIDEIVAPGTELNPADNAFVTPPAIEDKRRRRR